MKSNTLMRVGGLMCWGVTVHKRISKKGIVNITQKENNSDHRKMGEYHSSLINGAFP